MFAMALAAFGPVMLVKGQLVLTPIEQARVRRVTKAATSADVGDAGRAGGVIAMTVITGGSAEIAAREQRLAVHAFTILRQLICRDGRTVRQGKSSHDLRIRMARAAGLRHTLRVDL